MIQAFFDDYNKLTIEINTDFYNGNVNEFVLKTTNTKTLLNCTEVSVENGKRILEAILDNEIEIEETYYLDCEYGFKTDVCYRYIVKTDKFNSTYYTDTKLGTLYSKTHTEFNLWAPTAKRVILQVFNNQTELYEMKKTRGVFSVCIKQDLANVEYSYLVHVNNQIFETVDPYAISVTKNCKRSIVIDKSQIYMFNKQFKLVDNPSVYELSVKYFTADNTTNHQYRETFKGLYEEGTTNQYGDKTGFDYLKELGISHIQLMPINDFHTIDDIHNDTFNWGYDPQHFLALKNTYCYATNPIEQINEFKYLVEAYNNYQIGVNIDVVFNHVYNTSMHAFNKIVPYYYYRIDSNGSFCGNDIATEMPMARSYAITIIDHLVNTLQVDGIRFDLMGLMDISTLQQIKVICGKEIMLYGEGWDMPTKLETEAKGMHKNASMLPNYSFFNDFYRDSFRGKNQLDNHQHVDDLSLEALKQLIDGVGFTKDFKQSVNYVECHDDYTLYDKISNQYNNSKTVIDFINKLLIISRGITFIHSGQEVYRTKNNICNTYCMGYQANNFNWDNISKYQDSVNLFKEYLALKKQYNLGYGSYNYQLNDCLEIMIDNLRLLIDKNNYSVSYEFIATK